MVIQYLQVCTVLRRAGRKGGAAGQPRRLALSHANGSHSRNSLRTFLSRDSSLRTCCAAEEEGQGREGGAAAQPGGPVLLHVLMIPLGSYVVHRRKKRARARRRRCWTAWATCASTRARGWRSSVATRWSWEPWGRTASPMWRAACGGAASRCLTRILTCSNIEGYYVIGTTTLAAALLSYHFGRGILLGHQLAHVVSYEGCLPFFSRIVVRELRDSCVGVPRLNQRCDSAFGCSLPALGWMQQRLLSKSYPVCRRSSRDMR